MEYSVLHDNTIKHEALSLLDSVNASVDAEDRQEGQGRKAQAGADDSCTARASLGAERKRNRVTYKQRMIESGQPLSNPVVAGSIPAAPTSLLFQALPVANNNFHHQRAAVKPHDFPCLLVAVLIAWTALIVQARCQDLRQAPEPQKTPTSFWLLTGAYSASILGDDLSTQRFERMGCVEAWNPGLYGRRPSNARFLAISFGLEAASVIPARRMVRAKSRIWKSLGYAGLAWQTEGRADAIGHNLNLTKKVCAQ